MPVHVHSLTVSKGHADQLLQALETTIRRLPFLQLRQLYLVDGYRKYLVISFDGSYRPFLGFTIGYNTPEDRAYLQPDIWLLDRIGEYLEEVNMPIPGGRVFLNRSKVYKVFDDRSRLDLCLFNWQGDIDIVRRCYDLWRRIVDNQM